MLTFKELGLNVDTVGYGALHLATSLDPSLISRHKLTKQKNTPHDFMGVYIC